MESDFNYTSKYKSTRRQTASLAARALIRMLYACYWARSCPIDTLEIRMEKGPVLYTNTAKKLYASLSHSGEKACAVISDGGPIGLDLEKITPDRDLGVMIKHIYPAFSGDEQAAYHFWTLLEAYGKAKGTGLDFADCDTIHRHMNAPQQKEGRHRFMVQEGYALSLFVLNDDLLGRPAAIHR